MSEFEVDLEDVVSEAWATFEAELVEKLWLLDSDEPPIVIDVEVGAVEVDETVARYVQCLRDDDGTIHLEVSSNEYLTDPHRLTPVQEEQLVELGFTPPCPGARAEGVPGSANWAMEGGEGEGDAHRLGGAAVTVLREVFGVIHPAFLHSAAFDPEEDAVTRCEEDTGPDDEFDGNHEPHVVRVDPVPTGPRHLQWLVDQAMATKFDGTLVHDDDGDIPITSERSVTFIRVNKQCPAVEIFTTVVEEIEDLEAAAFEVNVLNRDSRFIRYYVADKSIHAELYLPASPFSDDQLHQMVELFINGTDVPGDDVAKRVKGRRPWAKD